MPSKQVTDREKSARAVAAAANTHAATVAASVEELLRQHLQKSEKMPDVGLLLVLVGRSIEAAFATLKAADKAHENELSDDAAPRERRDAAAESVRGTMVDLRAAIESAYGVDGLRALGIDAAVPEDPSVLAAVAERASTGIDKAQAKLPPPRRRGVKVDLAPFAEDLGTALPKLNKALSEVAREEREAEATLANKWTAMEKNDRTFARAASFLSAAAALGGHDEIAARVRPSGRRPGQTAAPNEGTGEGGSGGGGA